MRSNYLQSILRIRTVCARTKCIYRTPDITREATLSTDACTCPINFQRDGTHRFCVNIYYSVSRGRRLHSTLTHRTRVISSWQWRQWDTTEFPSARVPDPSFFQIKKRWTLATSDVWWRVGSREALWRCNARAADFFSFFSDFIYPNERCLGYERYANERFKAAKADDP